MNGQQPNPNSQFAAAFRQIQNQLTQVQANYQAFLNQAQAHPPSVQDQINSVPGRRVPYVLGGTQSFTATNAGTRASAINCLVSQDGPFIWTHQPLVVWKPNLPSNATNFGRWRPVYSWPLPSQVLGTDIIDLSAEIIDGGSQRNYQNIAVGAGTFSNPDYFVPLPEWSVVAPNSILQFVPTYEAITFNSTGTATTGGLLFVGFIGFRVVNS